MAGGGEQYGLIKWYLEIKKQKFDNFEGTSRDDVLDTSSENFFDEMQKYAAGEAKTTGKRNAINSLSSSDWKSPIGGKISEEADEWFTEKLKTIVRKTTLPSDIKNELEKEVKDYDSEEDLDTYIKEKVPELLKEKILDATSIEEVESIDIGRVAGLTKTKRDKLASIESMKYADVADRFKEENPDLTDREAFKLAEEELGPRKY